MRPLILISPDLVAAGSEFPDPAANLGLRYAEAITQAGGVPVILAPVADQSMVRAAVERCDGVLLTGGDDIAPQHYAPPLASELRSKIHTAELGRDLFEFLLVDEALRQNRSLLAICRGQQLVNVALGGDLLVDLPSQRPQGLVHPRLDARRELVHEVELEPGSRIASIAGAERIGVNSTHHQAVNRIAPPLRATAHASDGVVEALEWHPDHEAGRAFLLTVQWHPERLGDRHPEHAGIFRAFVEAAENRSRPAQ